MYLITVIPISKGIGKETLTYFSSQSPEVGSVIDVPLRNKKVSGIVLDVSPAEVKKSELKTLSYGLKKIDKIKAKNFLLSEFVQSAKIIADYYATTSGAVLSALIPKVILESPENFETAGQWTKTVNSEENSSGEVLVLQSDDEDRYGAYKSFIRGEFAKKRSVYICLPTKEEIKSIKTVLEKGIEPYTFVLHNGLPKKELIETWRKILNDDHPVLIIATGFFLSIPRKDIGAMILESESSRGFCQPTRPFLDIRTVAEIISKKMRRKLILGDKAMRVETVFRQKENEIAEFSAMKFRVLTTAECTLEDVRTPKNQTKKEFEIIGSKLSDLIEKTKTENDQLFLFCARKGLSPLTVCADCGDVFSCPNCRAPMVLYGARPGGQRFDSSSSTSSARERNTVNYFLCHVCREKIESNSLCKRCGSWKLTPLGIGIESTERELKKKFPDLTLFIMDKNHVKTHKQAESIVKKFYDKPGSVLLATELALPYIKNKISNTAVVSLDSFFSIPDFKINEKIMNIILSLRSVALKKVLIQTRRPEEKIFDYALKGNLSDFYRDEIEERKRFGYPPFNTFIKISLEGNKTETRAKMEKLKEDLNPYNLDIFEAFRTGINKKYIVHGLLILPRKPREYWIDPILITKLKNLNPQFSIRVDPDTLL